MNSISLLIADDHHLFLDGITSLLKTERDIVVTDTAQDGNKAIDLVRKNHYDICLLDISMPGMDGIETSKQIRKLKPDQKIIILTTYNDKEIVSEVIQAEVKGYLLKNSSKAELIEAIQKVAEGGTYFHNDIYDTITSSYADILVRKNVEDSAVELTQREEEIIRLLAKEYTNDKIAVELNISYRTVETHRKNMMQKTKAHNLAGLLKFAYNQGLIK